MSSLDQLAEFVDRYRQFRDQSHAEQFSQFCREFRRLESGLSPLRAQAAAERQRTAASFNIFRVLGVDYDEVRTHSALLADLLDPKGSHAQGTLFLEGFLTLCGQEYRELAMPLDGISLDGWRVETEKSTTQGLLDIVVSSRSHGVLLVIENKIWAGEQPQQLARYDRWLHEQVSFPKRALVYLTPDGRTSITHDGAVYFSLSYRDHILPWLDESLVMIEAPRLKETLYQYLDVLRTL